MTDATLPVSGFGLSWVLEEGKELVTKSLAPSFVFVDFETFVNTNVCQRLRKRSIDIYVSINAPMGLLSSLYGWNNALEIVAQPMGSAGISHAVGYVSRAIEEACAKGADAIVLCDDLCGYHAPVMDPLVVVEHFLPLYERFAQEAKGLEVPIIFHSEGDIRNYYAPLAADGFAGVHIAHPEFDQTAELFKASREEGLIPVGGLVSAQAVGNDPGTLARFALDRLKEGDALICDDGAVSSVETLKAILEALTLVREGSRQ